MTNKQKEEIRAALIELKEEIAENIKDLDNYID